MFLLRLVKIRQIVKKWQPCFDIQNKGNGKNRKGVRVKSHNCYISLPCGGAISQPIHTKFGEYVDLSEFVTPAKFGSKIFIGFFQAERSKNAFSL